MADSSVICSVCSKDFAVLGCCCVFPVPLICAKQECLTQHHNKTPKAAHNELPVHEVMRITQREDLHRLKVRFVNIDEGKGMLERNLKAVEECKESVKEHFASLKAELDDIEQDYRQILNGYYSQITEAIHNAVKDAKTLVFESEWPANLDNPLAKVVWEYGTGPSSPDLELFNWNVSRPSVALKGLVTVQMYSKRFTAYLPDKPKLALVLNRCLHELDTRTRKWSSVRLQGEGLTNFKHSWDSVSAYFEDNIRLLCTGGSSPTNNNTYAIEILTGKVTEKNRMRYSRCGHGMSQYNGKFYVFGGSGAKRTAEKYEPEEDSWTTLSNMRIGHQWFTTCIHHDKIYLCGGDSPVIEYFTPSTEEFTEASLRLEGVMAEASFSIASVGEDIVFISQRNLRLWSPDSPVLNMTDRPFVKALKSVWSCMTPVSDGSMMVFMPSHEGKYVKCFNLNTLAYVELGVPELVDLQEA